MPRRMLPGSGFLLIAVIAGLAWPTAAAAELDVTEQILDITERMAQAMEFMDENAHENAVTELRAVAAASKELEKQLDPSNSWWLHVRKLVSVAHLNAGSCLDDLERHQESVTELRMGLPYAKQYVDDKPDDAEGWALLVSAHLLLSTQLDDLKEAEQSAGECDAAIAECERGLALHPDDAQLKKLRRALTLLKRLQ